MSVVGNPPANYVVVRHDNGLLGYYWHLKKGSVTTKDLGARVAVGEKLGFVGSSGFSTGPHLHFEVRDGGGAVVDPYAGACGVATTGWTHQAKARRPGLAADRNPCDGTTQPVAMQRPRSPLRHPVSARGHGLCCGLPARPAASTPLRSPSCGPTARWRRPTPRANSASGFWEAAYWYTSLPAAGECAAGRVAGEGELRRQDKLSCVRGGIGSTKDGDYRGGGGLARAVGERRQEATSRCSSRTAPPIRPSAAGSRSAPDQRRRGVPAAERRAHRPGWRTKPSQFRQECDGEGPPERDAEDGLSRPQAPSSRLWPSA